MFQEVSACLSFALLLRKQKNNREKNNNIRKKSVEYFFFFLFCAFYVKPHTHIDRHTRTENAWKIFTFREQGGKVSEKLAIGLTLTNKLTRFSCDAEYQSPPEPACARSFLLAGMESNDDDDDDDGGTNREQQVRSCSALPITAHVLSGTCPATTIRCSTAASDCNTHSPSPPIPNTPLNPFLTPFSMQLQSPQMNCNFKPRSKVCNENEQIAEILAAATRRRRRSRSRRERDTRNCRSCIMQSFGSAATAKRTQAQG